MSLAVAIVILILNNRLRKAIIKFCLIRALERRWRSAMLTATLKIFFLRTLTKYKVNIKPFNNLRELFLSERHKPSGILRIYLCIPKI